MMPLIVMTQLTSVRFPLPVLPARGLVRAMSIRQRARSVASLSVQADFSPTGADLASYKARTAATKPTTTNLTTHGTELWSRPNTSNSQTISGAAILSDIPSGTYIWFYPTASNSIRNRVLELRGVDAVSNNPIFTATHTVGASETVATGDLKYDITNEASVTDVAGNAVAAKAATTISNTAIDTTAPTISSVASSGTTLTVTMSEEVYATTTPGYH